MGIMASQSFLLFYILFLTPIDAQNVIPDSHMPDLGMVSQPSPAPLNPGMAPAPSPECPAPSPTGPAPSDPGMTPSAPSAAPSDPGMAPSAPSAAPSDAGMASSVPGDAPSIPGMASAPSSAFDLGVSLPPILSPLNLNCSRCPIDPFALAACEMLIAGINPDKIELCCTTLSSLSKEDASACLCNAIELKAVKIGDFDVTEAMNKALAVCRPEPSNQGMALAPSSAIDPGMASAPSSAFHHGISLRHIFSPRSLNCSSCPIDPFGLAACGMLIIGNIKLDTVSLCCRTLTSLSREDASACLCNAIKIKAVKIGGFDVTEAMDKALDVCRPEPANSGMALAPATSSGFDLGISSPPSIAPPKLNCSGCPIDPFGLAACGILISGRIRPGTIGLCCTALNSITKEDASSCICHAIEIKAIKFGDFDVTDAINKVLAACNKL